MVNLNLDFRNALPARVLEITGPAKLADGFALFPRENQLVANWCPLKIMRQIFSLTLRPIGAGDNCA